MIQENHIYFWSNRCPATGFLCNFYPSPITCEGRRYATAEHLYHALLQDNWHNHERVRAAPTARDAMLLGRELRAAPVDNPRRLRAMHTALQLKFGQNPQLVDMLRATGNSILHEDSPEDYFWGILGHDHLGRLLMEVREALA